MSVLFSLFGFEDMVVIINIFNEVVDIYYISFKFILFVVKVVVVEVVVKLIVSFFLLVMLMLVLFLLVVEEVLN